MANLGTDVSVPCRSCGEPMPVTLMAHGETREGLCRSLGVLAELARAVARQADVRCEFNQCEFNHEGSPH